VIGTRRENSHEPKGTTTFFHYSQHSITPSFPSPFALRYALTQDIVKTLFQPMQLIVGLLTVELYMPSSFSLKDKRIIVKGLKDKIRSKFNVSISEVDYLDKWQRSRIGIVQVGNNYGTIEKNLDTIFHIIDSNAVYEIIDHSFEFI
jgi:uncharacterized protein YlxP (DUF503 family)